MEEVLKLCDEFGCDGRKLGYWEWDEEDIRDFIRIRNREVVTTMIDEDEWVKFWKTACRDRLKKKWRLAQVRKNEEREVSTYKNVIIKKSRKSTGKKI
jgi:hypothetical protein